MGNTLEQVVSTLSAISGYRTHFKDAFGDSTITSDRIAKALAAFERTLISGESPYDLFEYGGPKGSMSASAIRGLRLFRTKARCTLCHMGFNYTDEDFHNIGTSWDRADLSAYEKTGNLKDIKGIDPGRYTQTKKPEHFWRNENTHPARNCTHSPLYARRQHQNPARNHRILRQRRYTQSLPRRIDHSP